MLLAAVLLCHGTRPAEMICGGRTRNQTRVSPWGQQVEANIVEWEVLEGHCSPTRVLQCAPECPCPCRQTFWCVLQSVHLVRKVCEYTAPPGGLGIQTACCSLELGGLRGSQGSSSFAGSRKVAPEVLRGCGKKAVEQEGKLRGRERDKERKHH